MGFELLVVGFMGPGDQSNKPKGREQEILGAWDNLLHFLEEMV